MRHAASSTGAPSIPASGQPVAGPLSVPQVAHELNSLLDGAMRSLRLALADLEPANPVAITRLEAARQAMADIAAILEGLMRDDAEPVELPASHRTLAEEANHVIELQAAFAAENRVALTVNIDPDADRLPAGPLGTLLSNALRNAISACALGNSGDRRVDVNLAVHGGAIVLHVADTGPGLRETVCDRTRPPLGLDVCRHILQRLGGELTLASVPFGGGTVLTARIPRERIAAA